MFHCLIMLVLNTLLGFIQKLYKTWNDPYTFPPIQVFLLYVARCTRIHKSVAYVLYSHKVLLSGLNKAQNSWDAIFRRLHKVYICSSKKETMSLLAAMSRSDSTSIIARNIKFICDKWRAELQRVQYRWNKDRLYVHSQQELLEAEYVVAMVKRTDQWYNRF